MAIWTQQWPFPCVCSEESAGESSPCTSSFRQLVLFSVPQSFLACTTVRTEFGEIMLPQLYFKNGFMFQVLISPSMLFKWLIQTKKCFMPYLFCCLFPFRCPVGLSRMFQYDWAYVHSWYLFYLPRKSSQHCQWLLWPGTLFKRHSQIFKLTNTLVQLKYPTHDFLLTSLQHRLLAQQHSLFVFWLLWIHTTTPSPKVWRPSLWDLWFWSLDCLWASTLAMLSTLPETSGHVFSRLWLAGAAQFSRKCADIIFKSLREHKIKTSDVTLNSFFLVTPQG